MTIFYKMLSINEILLLMTLTTRASCTTSIGCLFAPNKFIITNLGIFFETNKTLPQN